MKHQRMTDHERVGREERSLEEKRSGGEGLFWMKVETKSEKERAL